MHPIVEINLHPFEVPAVWHREMAIQQYAEQYVRHAYAHEALEDFAEQAALDLKDRSAAREVKREIRKLQKERV